MLERVTTAPSTGTLAEVWIDVEVGYVEKRYRPGGITCTGEPNRFIHMDAVRAFFEREVTWSTRLAGPYTVKMLDCGFNRNGYFIRQEYLGPDLMTRLIDGSLHAAFPTLVDQLEEMFKFYQSMDVFKLNHALSNLTGKDGQIKAFDFKYTRYRSPDFLDRELTSLTTWLSKAGPTVVDRLKPYIISPGTL